MENKDDQSNLNKESEEVGGEKVRKGERQNEEKEEEEEEEEEEEGSEGCDDDREGVIEIGENEVTRKSNLQSKGNPPYEDKDTARTQDLTSQDIHEEKANQEIDNDITGHKAKDQHEEEVQGCNKRDAMTKALVKDISSSNHDIERPQETSNTNNFEDTESEIPNALTNQTKMTQREAVTLKKECKAIIDADFDGPKTNNRQLGSSHGDNTDENTPEELEEDVEDSVLAHAENTIKLTDSERVLQGLEALKNGDLVRAKEDLELVANVSLTTFTISDPYPL